MGKGDAWDVDFDTRLPDSDGEMMHVKAKARVKGWRTVDKRRCLVIVVDGEATLKDTTVTLRNGDRMHVKKGKYTVAGETLWDVQQGLFRSATASSALTVSATKPQKAELRARSKASLKLASVK